MNEPPGKRRGDDSADAIVNANRAACIETARDVQRTSTTKKEETDDPPKVEDERAKAKVTRILQKVLSR